MILVGMFWRLERRSQQQVSPPVLQLHININNKVLQNDGDTKSDVKSYSRDVKYNHKTTAAMIKKKKVQPR